MEEIMVTFRAYQKQDFYELSQIIRKTWNYDAFSSPKTAGKLARVFLSSCLTNQTFSRVAVLDGKPVGIILVKNKKEHHCPVGYRYRQIQAIASLLLSREGRAVSKIFRSVDGIDRELLAETGEAYPAELALFAVSDACRGKGIGKQLFEAGLSYLRKEGLKRFYLFTDTTCNYGFYEHQGLRRRCERPHAFIIGGKSNQMNFFIYDYELAAL